jgi:hypothetical protein
MEEDEGTLKIGKDTFNFEEFDTTELTEMERVKAQLKKLSSLFNAFSAGCDEWTWLDLPGKVDALIVQLNTVLEEHGKLASQGYPALKLLPEIALFACKEVNRRLPESSRLAQGQQDHLVLEFAKRLDPDRYTDGYVKIINYADLLDYRSAESWKMELPKVLCEWLRSVARENIAKLQELPEPDSEEMQFERQCDLEHLARISIGQFPFGFNEEHETRWATVDMHFLLEPDGDFLEQKQVTKKTYAHLMRIAAERLEVLEGKHARHKTPLSPEYAAREQQVIEHLRYIVESRQLPYGYRVSEEDDEIEDIE